MFFDGLHELTGSKTSFDDIISNALAGTGDFDGKSDSFRYYAVQKCGIAALQLQTMYLLETALTEAAAGTATAASKWDQAYAIFTGVSGNAAGTVGQLVGGVMQKRDSDFPAPAVVARDHVMKHFAAGQKAILADTYDAAAATAAAAEIRRLIGITFARATIKYSSTMKDADPITDPAVYSDTGHPESFCYWRAMAGWMSKKADMKSTAVEIDGLLALTLNDADITQPETHCSVKQKLETMLPNLGITCDDIGVPKESLVLHTCEAATYGTCADNAVAATTDAPTDAPTGDTTGDTTDDTTDDTTAGDAGTAGTNTTDTEIVDSHAPVAALGVAVALALA